MSSVGVAISTTRSRPQLLAESISGWRAVGLEPIVVNDLECEGVAVTKNRSLAALLDAGCEHLFLADDDMHPLTRFSWTRYVDDPALHLSLSWGKARALGSDDEGHSLWKWPRGVLLYFHASVIEAVGGYRTEYRVAHEHADISRRIYQAGITPHMFIDLEQDPRQWFHCEDMQRSGESVPQLRARRRRLTTIKRTARDSRQIAETWNRLDGDTTFVPFR